MKNINSFFVVCLLMLSTINLLPQEMKPTHTTPNKKCIQTLLMGLNSENDGVQAGCIYMFGELCCDKAVIPLLRILHNDPREEIRILDALSLYKIGDSRGIFAIKQAGRFDESDRVKRLCKQFFRAYLSDQKKTPVSNVVLR